jgi:hypothetical protein
MSRPPIDEDEQLLQVMGTDPQQWASSYLRISFGMTGDRLHIHTANWFAAAIRAGKNERDHPA